MDNTTEELDLIIGELEIDTQSDPGGGPWKTCVNIYCSPY